jgi:CelD/BcsL family acetyltransferase involved in cellulose biosynthesis
MDTATAAFDELDLTPLDRAAADAPAMPASSWAAIGPAAGAARRLAADWDELAKHAAEPNAFAERWFVAPALRNLAAGSGPRMIEVWTGTPDRPVLIGLLPVDISPRYGRAPVPHVQNWLHSQSFLGAPLVRAGQEQAFWSEVLAALDRDRWARGFLHIHSLVENGPLHRGLVAAAAAQGRPCDIVHRLNRALIESDLTPEAYYERTVRKKKRKELKRLSNRLAELGAVTTDILSRAEQVEPWCDAFLALERSQWKGETGTALACRPETELFFREAVAGAFAAGKLQLLRMDLDGRPLAMLVNFLAPPGSFSFKIAFDEAYARFSPGVLIQIENYAILSQPGIGWMDSCAIQDHSMINSLWQERRTLVRVTLPLAGAKRRTLFRLCRIAENASAALKPLFTKSPQLEQPNDD